MNLLLFAAVRGRLARAMLLSAQSFDELPLPHQSRGLATREPLLLTTGLPSSLRHLQMCHRASVQDHDKTVNSFLALQAPGPNALARACFVHIGTVQGRAWKPRLSPTLLASILGLAPSAMP